MLLFAGTAIVYLHIGGLWFLRLLLLPWGSTARAARAITLAALAAIPMGGGFQCFFHHCVINPKNSYYIVDHQFDHILKYGLPPAVYAINFKNKI
jgi:hypothetical protein